jgi:hypothetical protein
MYDFFSIITIFGMLGRGDEIFMLTHGMLLQPAIGVKIPFGKSKSFAFLANLGLDIKILSVFSDFSPYSRIGIGYSF